MKFFKQIIPLLLTAFLLNLTAAIHPQYDGDYLGDSKSDGTKQATIPVQANRVHRAGLYWLNMTNSGYFGNPDNLKDPCTGRNAVSGELPGGSGTDFMFVSGLVFGGYIDSTTVNVNGTEAKVFQGPLVSTAFEGWTGAGGPGDMAREMWPINFDEDPSGATLGKIYESSNVEGRVSCLFEEVYDPIATAEEQFTIMYTDKFVQRSPYTGMDDYDKRDHIPLGIEVRQKSYAWSYDYAQKFIIIDYTLYNRNDRGTDIYDFFMGVYLDPDIGHTSGKLPSGGNISANHGDDIGGFVQKWEYYDEATNTMKVVDLNMAYFADNDGRNYEGQYDPTFEPGAGEPLDGATSIATVRVLRNPNPSLRFSYNIYIADSDFEDVDWGPRWQTGLHPRPLEDHPNDPAHDTRAVSWNYDLSMHQKGYDDTNHDELRTSGNSGSEDLYGGRTEGRPIGDRGRYMVMSNDEFDYDQIDIREVYLGVYEEPEYVQGTPFAQADKWQKWTTPSDVGHEADGFNAELADGDIKALNDIANGRDVKALLSFGPLGFEDYENVAWKPNADWVPQSVIQNKKVWKFAHGDSLKLTLAFIVSENFHTSLDQDPNYADDTEVNLDDGLQKDLFQKGWFDALYNVVWAERVYDIPMYDTPVTRNGETKGDGWYGEDVGADGLFGDLRGDTFCWWFNEEYPGPDDGEGNFELTTFTNPRPDIYGHTADSEDTLLPFGRQHDSEDGTYGITGDAVNGDRYGFGYMVKYDKIGGQFPQGTWVRYGFDDEKITVGDGVPDFTGPPPPPSPDIKISYFEKDVIVEWQSHEFFYSDEEAGYEAFIGPEHFIDPFTRVHDFEGYQIQISPDQNLQNYSQVFGVDRVNYIYENVSQVGKYLDSPFSEQIKDSLVNIGEQVITTDNHIWKIVPYGNNTSMYENHSQPDVYTFTAEEDSKEITIEAGQPPVTVNFWKYKFVLHNRLLAKQNYIAVTASDFGDPKSGTPALKSNPTINGTSVIPTTLTGTSDIVVVPNPYRGDADYEKLGWENVGQADVWTEQDRKIVFMNVPSRCVLRIYTLAGDLVKTIGHNGNARVSERYHYGENGIAWDLINENNQAVVSGIYLYSVQDVDDSGFEHVGKFVIIK